MLIKVWIGPKTEVALSSDAPFVGSAFIGFNRRDYING